MRILFIGGTRFVGPPVVAALSNLGHEVTVFHRGKTESALPCAVKQIFGDRGNLAKHQDELRQLDPEIVVDMIPLTERDAENLANTFRGIARRIVAISSADVYRAYGRLHGSEPGLPDPVPLTEDAPLREKFYPYRGDSPRSQDDPRRFLDDYDKILVERIVMGTLDLPGTVLRLPMVYGPRDYQHRLFDYLKRMLDKRPAILLDEGMARWRGARGYVENVATAIVLAVTDERAMNRIYNVAEAEATPQAEWIERIGQAIGWNGRVVVLSKGILPAHLAADFDTDQHLVIDSTRIRRELGYSEQVSQGEALARTIEWERAHPPEPIDPRRFDYTAEDAALKTFVQHSYPKGVL